MNQGRANTRFAPTDNDGTVGANLVFALSVSAVSGQGDGGINCQYVKDKIKELYVRRSAPLAYFMLTWEAPCNKFFG